MAHRKTKDDQMLFFKACAKCITGTVELRQGFDGPEFKCVNCGHESPVAPNTERQVQEVA